MTRLALLTAVLLLAACGSGPAKTAKHTWLMPVLIEPVAERSIAQEVHAGGTLDPAAMVQVTSRVAGVVEKVAFNAGDVVKADQVLVEIEPNRFHIAVDRAIANLAKAEVQVADARASLARREELFAHGGGMVSAEEVATWRSKLALAEADVQVARADLDQAKLDARDAEVKAPIAATVETRSVDPGQFLAAGSVIATQVQRLPMRLRAQVNTVEAGLLTVGQPVRVLPAAGGELSGTIVLVGAHADPGTRAVEVVAEITTAPANVITGGFAQLVALAGEPVAHPTVPQAALHATERGYLALVAVHEGEQDVARSRLVETGLRSPDGWVEIRSGLAVGDRLIVRGADGLRDGQPIAPTLAGGSATATAPAGR